MEKLSFSLPKPSKVADSKALTTEEIWLGLNKEISFSWIRKMINEKGERAVRDIWTQTQKSKPKEGMSKVGLFVYLVDQEKIIYQ